MSTTSPDIEFHPNSLVEKRLCPLCLVTKRIEEFRPHRKQAGRCHRARHCNACHCKREKERLAGKRREADAKTLHAAWGSLPRPETKGMCVEKFLLSLMKRVGGPEELAKQWHQCFTEATAMKRVRAAMAMLNLLERFERHRDPLSAMTTDDLEIEAQAARIAAMVESFQDSPDVAASIASQFGYSRSKSFCSERAKDE
ncbi:hypothetical protein [Neorhodopirellula pilleata]|uniref:Uncharacterized protein n=1 Tax=Neorhodopirellula pilleata TaxID=2714738 RepID=A0A5C6A8P4_9BACT|nr:hypothetical protein [Neorhodopirellula pilleata]TWT95760.1 hypothetical protein Pla100_34020 [Neorhodopirellula pilleata]